jgi:hypothetical protein
MSTTTVTADEDIALASGLMEEVVKRDYAEKGDIPGNEPASTQPLTQTVPEQTSISGGTEPTLAEPSKKNPFATPRQVDVKSMSYTDPETEIGVGGENPGLNQQINEITGQTTSQWIWNQIENFYPEFGAWLTKIDTDFVKKAKLEAELEHPILEDIIAANKRNKEKFRISRFHYENIQPPLQAILSKKGWEKVIPDEAKLMYGITLLGVDTYWKVSEIKDENRVLVKKISQQIKMYVDIRDAQQQEIDSMRAQMEKKDTEHSKQLSELMEQMRALQEKMGAAA